MKIKKTVTITMFLIFAGLLLFMPRFSYAAFTSISAGDAYAALTATDSTAVMFDTRTVDEYYGCNPPWADNPGCPDPDVPDPDRAFSGTPTLKMIGKSVNNRPDPKKLPIILPWWITGNAQNSNVKPENPAEVKEIIEELLATGVINFDTEIYLISRTGYRSYYMAAWMDLQTFYNARTKTTESFNNLFNIDSDGIPDNDLGGMQEWNSTPNTGDDKDGNYLGLPIWRTEAIAAGEKPPQIFTRTPDIDGATELNSTCVNFTITIMEPSAGFDGPITGYADITEVCVGAYSFLTGTYGECESIDIDTPADTVVNKYNLKMHLPKGTYIWSGAATNLRSTLTSLKGFSPNATQPGLDQRLLTIDAACTDVDCDGYAIEGGDCGPVDCDDNNADVYPGAIEICDTIDNDCDGDVDENLDDDGDTYTTCGGDCNDSDPNINPGATEECDGRDNNCDGIVDEGFDVDGDGYTTCDGDCNDNDPDINPGVREICGDAIDNDCNSSNDDDSDADNDGFPLCGGDCDDTDAGIYPGATEECDDIDNDCDGTVDEGFDADGDGYTTCGGDCNDKDPDINPGATEIYGDGGVDNNCDGITASPGNPPTAPELVYPSDGQTGLGETITFKWAPSTDLDGDKVTYEFLACEEDRDFTDCKIESVVYLESKGFYYYAGGGFGLFMLAAALLGDGRRKMLMIFAVAAITSSMLFISCGGGEDTGNGGYDEGYETYTGTGFQPNTTYKWKVVAKDGNGGSTESRIRTFTTQ